MPCPQAQEEIRVFLEFTGLYRKHIDGYARIVTPLTYLLKKGVNVVKEWTPECTVAVEMLKKAITKYPICCMVVWPRAQWTHIVKNR